MSVFRANYSFSVKGFINEDKRIAAIRRLKRASWENKLKRECSQGRLFRGGIVVGTLGCQECRQT
jgi:hypothetical protein